jgi:hypothetical protein
MKFILINIFFILSCSFLYSQEVVLQDDNIFNSIQKTGNNSGKVKIHQDQSIEDLVNSHIRLNEKQNGFLGYRVQVFFGSGGEAKKKAAEIKSGISSRYPDIKAHLIYETPNFKLRLGDFRSKNEAYKFKKELEEEYPSAFIVEDMIDFPKLN